MTISSVASRILQLESRHRHWTERDREEWTSLIEKFVRHVKMEPKDRRRNVRVPCGHSGILEVPMGRRLLPKKVDCTILNVSHTGLLLGVSMPCWGNARVYSKGGCSMPIDPVWNDRLGQGWIVGFKYTEAVPEERKFWTAEVYYPSYVQLLRTLSIAATA